MSTRKHRRSEVRSLELFRDHPAIDRFFRLSGARKELLKFADQIHSGGPSPLTGYGKEWFYEAAEDVEEVMCHILSTIRIDGESFIL